MEYTLKVSCTEEATGKLGAFIGEKGSYKAVTPIFPDLYDFYPWMRANGWVSAEYVDGMFHPWRVVRLA